MFQVSCENLKSVSPCACHKCQKISNHCLQWISAFQPDVNISSLTGILPLNAFQREYASLSQNSSHDWPVYERNIRFFLKQDFAFFSQEKDLVVIKLFTSIKFMN